MSLENIISRAKNGLKSLAYTGLIGLALAGGVREARADSIRPSSYSGDITNPTYAFDNGVGDTDTYSWIGSGNGWKYGYYDFILPPNPDNTLNIIYKNSILEMGEVSIDVYDHIFNGWDSLPHRTDDMSNLGHISFVLNSNHIEENTNLVNLRGGAWGRYVDFGFSSSATLQLYDLYIISIPEPSTITMMAGGLLALNYISHKKKNKFK